MSILRLWAEMASQALESICGAIFELTKGVVLTNTIYYPNETAHGVRNLLSIQEFFFPSKMGELKKMIVE